VREQFLPAQSPRRQYRPKLPENPEYPARSSYFCKFSPSRKSRPLGPTDGNAATDLPSPILRLGDFFL
jgi:hypothetical protein